MDDQVHTFEELVEELQEIVSLTQEVYDRAVTEIHNLLENPEQFNNNEGIMFA